MEIPSGHSFEYGKRQQAEELLAGLPQAPAAPGSGMAPPARRGQAFADIPAALMEATPSVPGQSVPPPQTQNDGEMTYVQNLAAIAYYSRSPLARYLATEQLRTMTG